MAVGSVDQPLTHREDRIIRQDGKLQHHLVHLSITVAPHTEKLLLMLVQQWDDLLRGIIPGQIVAGAVIEQISQQEQPILLLPLKCCQHLLTIIEGPMQIRSDHPFHSRFILCW